MDVHGRLAHELTLMLRVMKELHTRVVEESDLPFELAGSFVLGRLAVLGPVRLTQLAAELGLDPSSVSRQVSSLERNGLLAKERDEHDLRAQRLVLTPAGLAAVQALRDARARELERLLPGWEQDEIESLTVALGRLNNDLTALRETPGTRHDRADARKERTA